MGDVTESPRLVIDGGRIVGPFTGWISPFEERFPSAGPKVCRFIEQNCVHGEGDFYGEPFRLTWWQRDLINRLFALRWDEAEQRWRRRFRKALIGLPKGNGKTELLAAIGLSQLCGQFTRSPLIPVAAASKEQANLLFGTARIMCEESPTLAAVTDAGTEQITLRGAPGRMYRVAAAEGTNDGQRPSLYIADEFHEWPDTKNVDKILANGTAKRADALELKITTAGTELDTMCGRLYQRGLKVAQGEIDDPGFLFYWLEPPENRGRSGDENWRDRETWRRVNPAADEFWPLENLDTRLHELLADNPPAIAWATFRRYFLNTWVETAEGAWLEPGQIEACEVPGVQLVPGAETFVGWDAASKYDSTAITAAQLVEIDGVERVVVDVRIWERPIDPRTNRAVESWQPPMEEVTEHLWWLARNYNVRAVQFDPAFVTWEAAKLDAAGMEMREFAQNGVKMVEASQSLYRLVSSGMLAHNGDPAFVRHMKVAQAKQTSIGSGAWRLVKGAARRPMDAAVSTAMAVWGLEHPGPPPPRAPRLFALGLEDD